MKNLPKAQSRRGFIGKLAAGTAVGLTALTAMKNPLSAATVKSGVDAESWFKKAKGDHRIVYDASEPHEGFPFIWNWVYYHSNNETGISDDNMTAMVVLRHNAIPFALEDRLWEKYKLGEVFNVTDKKTSKPSLRNLYYEPQEGDFPAPVVQGILQMQTRGAMFCVCNMALQVYSGAVAKASNMSPEAVYQEWKSGVLKDIQIVPSGVWAVGRAQKHGFGYCYAGG